MELLFFFVACFCVRLFFDGLNIIHLQGCSIDAEINCQCIFFQLFSDVVVIIFLANPNWDTCALIEYTLDLGCVLRILSW